MVKTRFPAVLKREKKRAVLHFQSIKRLAKMHKSLRTTNTKKKSLIKNIYKCSYFFAGLPLLVFSCVSAATALLVDSVVTSATFAPRLALLAG